MNKTAVERAIGKPGRPEEVEDYPGAVRCGAISQWKIRFIDSMGSLRAQSADGVEGLNNKNSTKARDKGIYRQNLRPVMVDYVEY